MIASQMVAAGLWPTAVVGISKAAAAGTTQATASRIGLADTMMVTGGTGGVVLSGPGSPGDTCSIINASGAAVNVYPAGQGQINGAGAGAAFSVGIAHCTTMKCLKAGLWFVTGDLALTGTIPTMDEEEAPPPPPPAETPAPAPAPGP